jgi:putative peptide zinc metalloprotease protein
MFIMAAIILFVAGQYFFIGVLLAAWAVVLQIVLPVFKHLRILLTSPQIRPHRLRSVGASMGILSLLAVLLFIAPAPDRSRAEGVLWLSEQAYVRTGTNGFVADVLAKPDQQVKQGDALIRFEDPRLSSEARLLQAKLQELAVRYSSHWSDDQVEAKMVQEQIKATQADLARTQERVEQLLLRSPADGRFVVPAIEDLPGRYIKQGEVVAYIVNQPLTRARVVVPQQDADRVRRSTRSVELRPVNSPAAVISAEIQRQTPAASNRLPSKALGNAGGGSIAVDPADQDGLQTAQSIFQLDLLLPEHSSLNYSGSRVFVRFDHGDKPLAMQWYRSLRQLFLRQFSV